METQDDQLSVEAAGRIAGISPRTLRSWIVHGKLPAVGGQRGKLVRLGDVLALAGADGEERLPRDPAEAWGDPAEDALTTASPQKNPAIDALLAELRDGVIWPLAERLEVLARENGRLAAERDAAVRARDELAAGFGSDNRFVDRLVELLQAELDAAHKRIAELEADLARAKASVEPDQPAAPAPVPRGLGRRRFGFEFGDPAPIVDGVASLLLATNPEARSPSSERPANRSWWKPWRGR